jgi:Ser/Thr protein kinase RdoA (MazF antagonist)
MSSAVHLVTAQLADGRRCQAVLRRYVRPELNREDPDIAARETRALTIAASVAVPTPVLLAADPAGSAAGVPALLMSRLPGRIDWWPSDADRWLTRLAELLPRIHATRLPPPGTIRSFGFCPPASSEPPSWARYPDVWERAAEISQKSGPRLPAVLLHGDFHPGNVLWRRGTISGVVDWQAVCTGPAVVDVAHCRLNLLTFGSEVADRFTSRWESAAAVSYHPWADVIAIIGFLVLSRRSLRWLHL